MAWKDLSSAESRLYKDSGIFSVLLMARPRTQQNGEFWNRTESATMVVICTLETLEIVLQNYSSGKRLHGVRQRERDESIMVQFILCAGRPEQKTT